MADCNAFAPTVRELGEATPLLEHLAGLFAPEIAGLWPAPHHEFISAPAARRHLICLWAASDDHGFTSDLLLALPLRRLLANVAPHAPPGTLRALSHIGETAWTLLDYGLLFERLADPGCAKLLRHSKLIQPELVRRLSLLPAPLLEAGLGRQVLDPAQALLLGDTFDAIRRRQGEAAAGEAARRWAKAGGVGQLFAAARDDLIPDPPPPPFPGDERLKPLPDKAAIRDAAKRFNNCLAEQLVHAADGSYVFYEWAGPPPAVIELRRDAVFGWCLNEVRLANNRNVPEAARAEMVAALREMGVQVGRDIWDLHRALGRATDRNFSYATEAEVVALIFGQPD